MHRTRPLAALAAAALLLPVLTGCGSVLDGAGSNNPGPTDSPTPTAPATSGSASGAVATPEAQEPSAAPSAAAVTLTTNVKDGTKRVAVDTLVSVRAAGGQLDKVSLAYVGADREGQKVTGTVAGQATADRAGWTATERLEPGYRYTLTAAAGNGAEASARQTTRFSTQRLSLDEQTFPTLQPEAGSKVGVGMPVILTLDVGVKNKAEFERNLKVTSTPAQPGTWHWYSDKEAHFRPRTYWKPGTKVTVQANLNSLPAGRGVYGQQSAKTRFTVGRSLITKINLDRKQAKVYRNGELVRRIPISAGKAGWVTRSGTKLIMEKLPVTRMTNEMIGAAESYDLQVRYAMRVTWSGEFLHAAPWNAAKLGRVNASHGCVGMSTGNAAWLFNQALAGDPVVTTGSSKGLEPGNGWTDWDVSYAEYKKGSALV